MQTMYLEIAMGVQFFLLVGYMLYMVFRGYSPEEAAVSLRSYVAVLISLITFGLIFSVLLVAPFVEALDRIPILVLAILDLFGLVLLVIDLIRNKGSSS